MNFYNPVTGQIFTEFALKNQYGVPNPYAAGMFLVRYVYPHIDEALEYTIPNDPVREGNEYVVYFTVNQKDDELCESDARQIYEHANKQIQEAAENVMAEYMSKYSELERMTFDVQREEAIEYVNNENANTPVIATIAENRGVEFVVQMAKTIEAIEDFSMRSSMVVGYQKRLEDNLKAIINSDKSWRDKIVELRSFSIDFSPIIDKLHQ